MRTTIAGHILMGSVLFAQNQKDKALAELNQLRARSAAREIHLSLARFFLATTKSRRRRDLQTRYPAEQRQV